MITQTFTGYTQKDVDKLVDEFFKRGQKISVIKTRRDIVYAKNENERKKYTTTIYYVRINV